MNRAEIDAVLKRIFSDLFDIAESSLDYGTSPDNVEKWDSLAQINLIAAIEEELEIEISPESQLDMLNFELIGDILQEMQ